MVYSSIHMVTISFMCVVFWCVVVRVCIEEGGDRDRVCGIGSPLAEGVNGAGGRCFLRRR